MDVVISGLVVLDSIRKQNEQVMWSKAVSSTHPHGLYISFCHQVPALREFLPSLLLVMNYYMELNMSKINPFFSKLLLVMVLYCSNSNPN